MAKKQLTIEEKLQAALVPEEEQPYKVPENWCWVKFASTYENTSSSKNKIKQKDYQESGTIAIVDQGEDLVGGYSDKEELSYDGELPVIIFGDHTRRVKFIDFPFIQGADGIKVLKPKDYISAKYYYYGLQNMNIPHMGYRRHFPILNKMSFSVAPLKEQYRIVARIESLFAKLDEAKEKIQEVLNGAALRKAAILHQAFTGKLTEKWRTENGIAGDGWNDTSSAELFEYVTSGSRGWAQYYSDDGAIFFRMGNLDHGTIDLDMSDIQYVDLPDKAEGQRSRVKKGDILISITADVGMVACIKDDFDEAYINQHIALARPKGDNSSEFIAWYFVSDVGLRQLQRLQRGATKVGLTLKDIKSVNLKMPCLKEQHEIVRLVESMLARAETTKTSCESALAVIDTLKKSILARAFRGELGTNDPSEASAKELLQEILAG